MKKLAVIIIFVVMVCPAVLAGETYKTKLSNGQTVIVKEVHDNPTVIVDTWIKTGSIDENDNNNGVAHFLEHLFFRGSENYPDKEFDKILESKGAVTNASTSRDFTHYYILIPSKDFETAVKLQADMLTRPAIPPKSLEQERSVVIREIERGNDNPQRIISKNFAKAFYKESPYRREVIGTKEIISNISRDEILDFYKSHYSPSNMVTVIAGDVNGKEAVNTVKKYFGDNKKSLIKRAKYKRDEKPESKIDVIDTSDVKTTYLLTGFKGPQSVKDRDSYALDIAGNILGGGKSSRLYKKLKDDRELVHGISASNSGYREDTVFYISANFEPQNLQEVQNEIIKQIYEMKKGVGEEEVALAKKQTERETLFSRETISNIASEIGYTTILTNDWNFYDNYLKELKKITKKDVNKAVNKYLNINYSVTSVIEPESYEKTAINKDIKTNINEGNKYCYPSSFVKFLNHNPKTKETLGKVEKFILDNGSTLIVDKHKNNEIIAISIKVRGGNYTEPKKGIGKITSQIMTKGTEKYPKIIYDKISEEKGITIVPTSGNETFSVYSKCVKEDLPLMLDMLNEVINNTVISGQNIEKVKKELLYSIKANRDNPANVGAEELKAALWENTPYGNVGKVLEKTIPTISENDIKNYYQNLFYPENIVVSVNGNVSEQEMINCFSEIFGAKEGKVSNYADYRNLFGNLKKNKSITTYRDSEAAWIYISWLTDGKTNLKDRMTLNIINAILGSGMSSRLFYEVRDKQGLAYAIGSNFSAGINKGSFGIFIGTDPSKADKAEIALMKEVEKLKTSYVSEKELEDAKNKLKGNYILSLETNGDKAENYALLEISGDGCNFREKMFKMIDEVTVNDVINVANKYFSQPYVVSKVLPKK